MQQTVVIVSGTELQAPLEQLETEFEQENFNIKIELKFQGSQGIVNKIIDQKNDFNPTVLMPASGELLFLTLPMHKMQGILSSQTKLN